MACFEKKKTLLLPDDPYLYPLVDKRSCFDNKGNGCERPSLEISFAELLISSLETELIEFTAKTNMIKTNDWLNANIVQ